MPENPDQNEQPGAEQNHQPDDSAARSGQPSPQQTGEPSQQDDQLGEKGLKALREEREARKALEKQLESLSPLQKVAEALGGGDADKGKSEIDQLSDRVSKQEQELTAARDAQWRSEVAHEKGLSLEQAARLSGSTRDELAADADELLKLFPSSPNRFEGTAEGGARKGSTDKTQLSAEDVKTMSADEVNKARREGRLDKLMGRNT